MYCQIELDEKVVVTRGDRFILRRATTMETIGGGWVIDPRGERYRFGEQTVEKLKQKSEGSVTDRLALLFERKATLTYDELLKNSAITEEELINAKGSLIQIENNLFTLHSLFAQLKRKIISITERFHSNYPMRIGINKAEIVSELKDLYTETLINYTLHVLQEEKEVKITHQYVALALFIPRYPKEWKKKLEQVESELEKQGAEVEKWQDLLHEHNIPSDIQKEFYTFLVQTNKSYVFDEERLITEKVIDELKEKLATHTKRKPFNLQKAREVLQLSRENLVPLLELLDELGYTKRDGNERSWI